MKAARGHSCSASCPPMHAVRPWLHVGSAAAAEDPEGLAAAGVTHVIGVGPDVADRARFQVLHVDELDLPEALLCRHFGDCVGFAAADAALLVHCAYGQSRSVTVACALLMAREGLSAQAALEAVEAVRPCCRGGINPGFRAQLDMFEGLLAGRPEAQEELRLRTFCWERGLPPPVWGSGSWGAGSAGRPLRCKACRREIASASSVLPHGDGRCGAAVVFVVPPAFFDPSCGRLQCPGCSGKLGAWDLAGGPCRGCGQVFAPSFQLTASRLG